MRARLDGIECARREQEEKDKEMTHRRVPFFFSDNVNFWLLVFISFGVFFLLSLSVLNLLLSGIISARAH